MEEKHKSIALFVLLLLFAYWSYLILEPFIQYVLFGFVLAFLFYPLYLRLRRKMGESLSASITLVIVFLLIILPCFWLAATLVVQAANAYQSFGSGFVLDGGKFIASLDGALGVDVHDAVIDLIKSGSKAVASSLPGIITGTGAFFLGLFLLFLVLFYALKDGVKWYAAASAALPLKPAQRRRLQDEIERATRALFFGQVLTAVLQGLSYGVLFALVGISNPVFWGFIMMVLAFLPFVGAPLVYLPAGVLLIMGGQLWAGIILIVLCTLLLFVIDNFVRPIFVSKNASIHPITVIIGAIGGIYLMGLLGFLIGPIILNVFLTLLSFDNDA